MKQKDLLTDTRQMLAQVYGRGRSVLTAQEIATGAGVSRKWVEKLAQGAVTDPGVTRVQKLHDFLAGRLLHGHQ
jgi:transcriptional regulator with XRE-family HTH domain